MLADVGAKVTCIDPDTATTLLAYLNRGKAAATAATSRLGKLIAVGAV